MAPSDVHLILPSSAIRGGTNCRAKTWILL